MGKRLGFSGARRVHAVRNGHREFQGPDNRSARSTASPAPKRRPGLFSPDHARASVKAADTSVVVAAFASWHDKHESARRALDEGLRLIEHCALETYSVLTRLPAPHRVRGEVVRDFIGARFKAEFLRLNARAY